VVQSQSEQKVQKSISTNKKLSMVVCTSHYSYKEGIIMKIKLQFKLPTSKKKNSKKARGIGSSGRAPI
jgi:hypothetical protein